jgi:hypothetical protein
MKRVTLMKVGIFLLASTVPHVTERLQGGSLNQPVFTAASGSPVHVGPQAGRPAVGDVNGDGNPDLIVACGTC